MPPPGDADPPPDDGYRGGTPRPSITGWCDDDDPDADPQPAWSPLPATTTQRPPVLGNPPHPRHSGPLAPPRPPGPAPPATTTTNPPDNPPGIRTTRPSAKPPGDHDPPGPSPGPSPGPDPGAPARRPPTGLLDLTMSWAALNGVPGAPASLGRLGPITTTEALPLAGYAALDPHAQWRVIVTDPDGRAIAVERVRRRTGHQPGRLPGLTGRVTVTIPATALDTIPDTTGTAGLARDTDGGVLDSGLPGTPGHGIRAAVLRAARRAAARAQQQQADDDAAGGCAHTTATPAYRPSTRIREYVEARDQTCRQPICRQPAWHTDIDHSQPYDQGGPTCPCNLGAKCRTHHQIKQLPGWTLTQPKPGHFQLTTPAGRTYETHPDTYPA